MVQKPDKEPQQFGLTEFVGYPAPYHVRTCLDTQPRNLSVEEVRDLYDPKWTAGYVPKFSEAVEWASSAYTAADDLKADEICAIGERVYRDSPELISSEEV